MVNFKIGDTVERVEAGAGGLRAGERGIVTGSSFGYVLIAGKGSWKHALWTLRLVDEQDDPLPPAPESVRYNEGAVGFTFEVKSLGGNNPFPHRIRLGVLCGDCDITHKYVCVDPDTALQLAHDLRRMAMEIKRKEKQDVI